MGYNYINPFSPENFHQGLKVGDRAVFSLKGVVGKYTPDGWPEVYTEPERVIGFDYPYIKTEKSRYHCTRYRPDILIPGEQLTLF